MSEVGHHILVVSRAEELVRRLAIDLETAGFVAHAASDSASAVEAAVRLALDVIIVDARYGIAGDQLLDELAAAPATGALPVMALVDDTSLEDRLRILQAGADGLLEESTQLPELVERMRALIRRSSQLRSLSPLTGMPGNRAIAAALRERLASPRPMAFAHVDLKHFKRFNDTFGFLAGDDMIRRCADCLHKAAAAIGQPEVFLGHIGGDDFAVILDAVQVDRFCRRLIELWEPTAAATAEAGGIGADDSPATERVQLAIGVATNLHRTFSSEWEVSALAAEMKEYAKGLPGSTYRIDRRRGRAPEVSIDPVYNEATKKPPSGQGAIPDRR